MIVNHNHVKLVCRLNFLTSSQVPVELGVSDKKTILLESPNLFKIETIFFLEILN